MHEQQERTHVGIVIFDDVEVLDFCGPFEVFSVTRTDETNRRETPSPFAVQLIAETDSTIATAGGMRVSPQATFASCGELDVLVVPGGWGTRREMRNTNMLAWLQDRAKSARVLAGVCTGSLLLGSAGLLDGRRATTHWRSIDWMQSLFPSTTVERDLRVVRDGHIFTSAGISAGIDLSLAVVAAYVGDDVARRTARQMEYPYPVHHPESESWTLS